MNEAGPARIYPGLTGDHGLRSSAAAASAPLLTIAVLFCFCHLWRLGDVNITFSDLFFVAAVFLELSLARLNGAPFGMLTSLWTASLLLMLTGLFVGSFVNGEMSRWLIVACQYLFSYMLLPMLLIRDGRLVDRLILTLITGLVAMEVLGIVTYYLVDGHEQAEALFGPDFITGNRRLGAFAGDSNWNGIIIAMTLPFVIYAMRKSLLPSWMGMVAILILLWALTLAASFTSVVATALAWLVMMIAGRMRPSPKIILFGCLILAALYMADYEPPEIFSKRVAPAIQTGSLAGAGTFDDRAELIAEAWALSEQTIIFGVGVDQFRKLSMFGQPVHNMYMLQLTEGGALALAGWLGLVLTLLYIPLAHLRRCRLEASLATAVILVFMVFTMASPHMYARFLTVPMILALGTILTRHDALPPLAGAAIHNRTRGTGQMY